MKKIGVVFLFLFLDFLSFEGNFGDIGTLDPQSRNRVKLYLNQA